MRWLRRIALLVLALLAAVHVVCSAALILLRWYNPPTTAVQAQRRIESWLAGEQYTKRSVFLPLNRIPLDLQHAVVAAEDGRFYQHHGIDWLELRKVANQDLEKRRVGRGASTITQQLVKNLFFGTYRSGVRKLLEFTLAPLAELILSKQRILELYLNLIEWGPGVYGAEAAARYHYGIPAGKVGREAAARLAAVIPAPRTRRPARMDSYSAEILARMARMGW
ncbi:MAG: monofunctional biosynthetic peptidoglycan transglycosylase [Bryobacterales bacterium]|nr:monofunctional biosynthetic peptidoglycan transglycosylase [Bryobacterales bacterium]